MNSDVLGIIMSLVYINIALLCATVLKRAGILKSEGSRKFIHISVSGFWVIAMIMFKSPMYAAVVPAVFIAVNTISLKFNLIKAMERPVVQQSIGTVYFAVSLFILAIVSFGPYSEPYIGALGVFSMGLGDGLAAVVGKRYGRLKYRVYGEEKSFLGSLTMFFFSFVSCLIVLEIYAPQSALITAFCLGAFACLAEAFSPKGTDNLTVPLGTSLVYWLVFRGNIIETDIVANVLIGILINLPIVFFAMKKRLLTVSGLTAAFITGVLFYLCGGIIPWVLLIVFFLSSGIIEKVKKSICFNKDEEISRKKGARDAVQVVVNSLPALVCFILDLFFSNSCFYVAGIAAIAASTADTWASEIGIVSKKQPVSIVSLKPLPPGLSGGVTPLGFFASFCGAGLITIIYAVLNLFFSDSLSYAPAVFLSGILGSVMDSLLGALFQAKYKCHICGLIMEKKVHHGSKTKLVSGFSFIDNDMVNLLSSIFASLCCYGIAQLL
ncbi:MAG: DUF92 domain-containing protein [Clostridiales bacterium]|jgi:uncharacterized protein (TIGR00297 family)|nr:DUF92 domain-containing protein [Clostridiales bacterium]